MQLTKNFTKAEFDSKDGSAMPYAVELNIIELAKNLQVLRDHIRCPIHINSGYRSPAHNAAVGGVKNSKHLIGQAADIRVQGMSSKVLGDTIDMLIKRKAMQEGCIGIYNTFVHYDIRGTKVRFSKLK